MSQENVDLVRASVAAINRGDLDAALKDFDPYVVIRPDASWPENRPILGVDAAGSFFEDLMVTLGAGETGLETAIDDLIDAGDRVVLRYRARVHGQRSGIEDEVVFSQVVTFRRGKCVMLEYFLDHQEALEAAGLSE
jgi:ketosteroid isomerase-like protein